MKVGRIALVSLLAACSGDSPIQNRVGEGSIASRIGPGGGVIRGAGGSPLEGFELSIPAGALSRLVDISIDPGATIAEAGTAPVSIPLQVRISPDPGVLRAAATMTLAVDVPEFRSGEDLVVLGRAPENRPTALSNATDRRLIVAETGVLDREADRFTFLISDLVDCEVVLTSSGRLRDDAARLVDDGYAALADLTSASVVEADVLFAEAQRADPYLPLANMLRSISRVLVALDDRRDLGPGFDSIGEICVAFGLDVGRESLLGRMSSGRWPRRLRVPPGAPSISEVQSFLRARIRPVLLASLEDLDRVPPHTAVIVGLPGLLSSMPGDREVDVTDVLALRALLAGAVFAIDWIEDLELDFDSVDLTAAGSEPTWQSFFSRYPMFGRLRNTPEARTIEALRAALFDAAGAFDSLDAELDEQADDILVFGRSFTSDRRARWRANLAALRESLDGDGSRRVLLDGARGGIDVDLSTPLASGAIEPALGLPEFLDGLPIGGTMTMPDLGGLFPGMTQQRATDLLQLFGRHSLPEVSIRIDGDFSDWLPASEALTPFDPVGDTRTGTLRAVDLERVFVASAGDDLVFRLQLASGAMIQNRPSQATAYGFTIRERTRRGFSKRIDVAVHVTASGLDVEVRRDGVVRQVATDAAAVGSNLELALDRFDFFDPDEPVAERVLWAFSEALETTSGSADGDTTRGIAVRF